MVAAHELGHALRLGDHCGSSWRSILMYGDGATTVRYAQAHDRSDYWSHWS